MSSVPGDQQTAPPQDPDELRAEIEQTREELVETAQALSDKLDVKKQARSAVGTVQERAKEVPGRAAARWDDDPVPFVAAAATFVLVLLGLTWKERR